MKEEIRIVGIDDGYFDKYKDKECLLVGVVMRGYKQIDGVLSTKIEVDGWDTTEKIINMIKRTTHYYQLRIIMLNGITFGGFNIVDIEKIYYELKLPVIVVIRKNPDLEDFKKAMLHLNDWEKRWELIKKIETPKPCVTKYGITYFQKIGLSDEEACEIIRKTAINSRIPEPVRVAHLIAMGVTRGYSRGKP